MPLALLAAALPAAPTPPASVRVASCAPDEHSAVFYARMRSVEDSERMSMRFTLLEKHLGRWEPLHAKGLSRWHRSKPGVGAFGYRQTVRGLQPGAAYRAKVSFRWYSADGELIDRARRRSATCRQFDEVPNLTSTVLGTEPTKVAGVVRYLISVANTGAAPAADVEVRLEVDGGVVDSVTVAALEPEESREVAVLGPVCTSSAASMADPDGVIVESAEDDNGHTIACQA